MELRSGSEGVTVEALQAWLKRLGYDIEVNGDFGTETVKAVRDFQVAFNARRLASVLRTDGVADDQTQTAIAATVAAMPSPGSSGGGASTGSGGGASTGSGGGAIAPAGQQPPGLIDRLKQGFTDMPTWQKTAVIGGGLVAVLAAIYAATATKSVSLSGFVDFLNGDEPRRPKTCSRTPSEDKLDDAEEILPNALPEA